ncbi:MAG: phosphopantetheine-binding protein [Bacteroidales bacterium]|nr:phosphopantetheine-binding protein [Bacteroidales bacterium]
MDKLIETLKEQIIEQLNLEDVEPSEIEAGEPLFGDDGFGLDSIDALELIVLLEKEYNLKIEDPKQGKDIFYSVESLAKFITENQPVEGK